jgi:hypothetical protein
MSESPHASLSTTLPPNAATTPDPNEAERLLRIYLQDHHAGAVAGLSLIKRLRASNEGTPLGMLLAELESEVAQDQRTLEMLMAVLGIRPSVVKGAVGAVTERVGRPKTNGRVVKYSRRPPSRAPANTTPPTPTDRPLTRARAARSAR